MLIAVGGLLLLGGGGGAAWYFMRGDKSEKPAHAKPKPSGPPVFLTLDPFVVNLAGDVQHYLQVGIDLRVADGGVTEQIKVHLPEIRNGVLLLLSSKSVEDLSSVDQKNLLRAEIREAVNKPLGIHTPAVKPAEPAAEPPEALSGTASVPAEKAAHAAPRRAGGRRARGAADFVCDSIERARELHAARRDPRWQTISSPRKKLTPCYAASAGRARKAQRAKMSTVCARTTSAARSASCAGACPRSSSSTSASHARCAWVCTTSWAAIAEISIGPVRVMKFSEFVRNLVVPTNLNIVQAKPLRGTALMIFEPTLVFQVIDNLFGGNGRFHTRVEGRDFTPTEMRIVQRMLQVAFEEMEKSWAPIYPIKFEYVRSEMNTQFANIATPTEVVIATNFTIDLGGGGGDFHMCMPYAMLEPIRDLIYSSVQADRSDTDDRWISLMSTQVYGAEVRDGRQSRARAVDAG